MTSGIRFSFSIRALALAIATSSINMGGPTLLLGWSMPAAAAPDASGATASHCAPPTAAQERILEAAANGVDALREHLWIRRGIRDDDLVATVRWIDDYRSRVAACTLSAGQIAQAAPKAPPAADRPR